MRHQVTDSSSILQAIAARTLACFLWILVGVVLSALGPHTAFAQSYLTSVGNVPFSTTLPVELGGIDASNGDLHLEVPLVTLPQRATAKPFAVTLAYDSRIWESSIGSWVADNVYQSTMGGWRLVTSAGTGGGIEHSTLRTKCYLGDPGQYYYKYSSFEWLDPSGTYRHFPINTEYDPWECDSDNPSDTEYATDSSGYQMVVTSYTTVSAIYAADGSQVYPNYQDTNGNYFALTGTDTLGRTPVAVTTNCNGYSYEICYDVPNAEGSTSRYTVTTESIAVHTAFGQSGVTEYSGNITVVQSIKLPDTSTYSFTYDTGSSSGHYGELTEVTLRTGATVSYVYTNFTDVFGNKNQWVDERISGSGTWYYSPNISFSCGFSYCQTVIVTKPSSDKTIYVFGLNSGNYGAWKSTVSYYTGSSTLVRTDTSTWTTGANYTQQLSQTSTWDTSVSSTTKYAYGSIYYSGAPTTISEWNLYSGTLPTMANRVTSISYTGLTHPYSIVVQDGSGHTVAQTSITYDGSSLTSVTGTSNHNDSYSGPRFNPTSVAKWVSGSTCTTTTCLTTTMTYDTTGQLRSVTNPDGNATSLSYTDAFYSDNNATPPSTYTPSTSTNAYLTEITPPLTGSSYFGYYYGTGQQTKSTDPNSQTTYSHFYDSLNRATQARYPDGGWQVWTYPSTTEADQYTSVTDTTPSSSCTGCRHDQTNLDTLGRPISSVVVNDPIDPDTVAVTYDSNGRTHTTSTPYRSTSDPTYGVETPGYDGLDRVVSVARASGGTAYVHYGSGVSSNGGTGSQNCSSSTYGYGYPTLTVDETLKKRETWIDAFGRIIEADEPDSSNNMSVGTCYIYDLNNNLTEVVQGAQTRYYYYDGLSRPTEVTTPEDGTTYFYYTTSGGSLCAGDPSVVCRKTDSRSITTTNTYDAMSRVTNTSFSDGSPSLNFWYDESSWGGVWTLANGAGRLSVTSGGTLDAQVFSYDAMGRVVLNAQTSTLSAGHSTPSGVYEVAYTYDLMGNLVTLTNGAGEGYGQTFTYTNNVIGQPTAIGSSLSDSNHPSPIVSSVTYTPFGALAGMTYGNGVEETRSYNNRLQPTQTYEYNPSTGIYPMNLTYSWTDGSSHNNGNLTGWNSYDYVAFTRTYTYDYLNRLSTMSSPSDPSGCYGLSWTYDRYGNRTAQTETSGTTCPQPSTPASTSTNQLNGTGISYDSAGNMTNDSVHSYTYNASNQLTAVDSGSTSTATYTVEGWRSNKTMGSNLRDYARARSGQVLSEMITSSSGGWDSAYIYLGNQLVAEYTGGSSGTTYFIHQDHLGNTRAVTAMNGNEYDWLDYYPFGEQAEGSTPTTQKFTGYQRDAEDGTANGTDYAMARKYAYSQGRLMSADPLAGDIGNPQSLNRYSYVLNSPLDAIDPTGMSCHWDDGTIDDPPPAGGDGPDQCAQDGGTYWADDPNGLPPPLITQFVWAAMPNNLPAPLIIQFVWAPMPTDDLSDLTTGSSGPIAFAGIGGSFLRGTQNAAAQALKQLAQDAGKTPFTKTPAPSLQPAGEAAPELEWENLAIKRLLALLSDWKITGIGDIPFMIDPLHGNYCAINYGNGCGAIQY